MDKSSDEVKGKVDGEVDGEVDGKVQGDTIQSWKRRDALIEMEKMVQNQWEQKNIHQATHDNSKKKYFITFPYPYMNGTMHLGHAYTASKADFIKRYMELKGYNVLFPFAFHGTGMPIVACANRLKDELSSGNLDNLPHNSQLNILIKMGVPFEELEKFTDPYYWLDYFPKRAKDDLQKFGLGADFSRSFTTTEINPHYDSFVKWQFNKLNQKGLLKFGKKYIVYSPKDDQPCADHDRSTGEGVKVKEYTAVKLKIDKTNCQKIQELCNDHDVFLLVATTRPETLYVMTNIWINKDGNYVLVKSNDEGNGDFYICREESVRNLKYQIDKDFNIICTIKGEELIDSIVSYPFLENSIKIIHLTVDMNKGTGIVASVPSHSVTDFKNYAKCFEDDINDLRNKSAIGVEDNDYYTVNEINNWFENRTKNDNGGELSKQIFKLEEEKGIMVTGKYKGLRSCEARELVKKDIILNGWGLKYYEPEEEIISRSGDRCVVALTDQWFINYGNKELTDRVTDYIKHDLETFNPQITNQFVESSNWINEWPCSRNYGLGTKLLDTDYVIDSLSDSTIYMAYYTVSHLLKDVPSDLFDDTVWNYLFMDGKFPDHIVEKVHIETLQQMKKEFEYWYPFDMRISGKDLVANHLTMSLYNHLAVWGDKYLPKSFLVNGHLLLNGEKMSKSTGNFMTLREAVDKYSADATRIALAWGGSGFDDANFTERNASAAILRLSVEMEWIKDMIDELVKNKEDDNEYTFWDNIFDNDINICIADTTMHFDKKDFQKVLISGFYNLLSARDNYRSRYEKGIIPINYTLMKRYIEVQVALVSPICPHWADTLWTYATNNGIELMKVWPEKEEINYQIMWYEECLNSTLNNCRSDFNRIMKRHNKKGTMPTTITLDIIVYSTYSDLELGIIENIKEMMKQHLTWNVIISTLVANCENKRMKGNYGKFARYVQTNIEKYGMDWLSWVSEDDDNEYNLVRRWLPIILGDLKNEKVIINRFINITTQNGDDRSQFRTGPGRPRILIIS